MGQIVQAVSSFDWGGLAGQVGTSLINAAPGAIGTGMQIGGAQASYQANIDAGIAANDYYQYLADTADINAGLVEETGKRQMKYIKDAAIRQSKYIAEAAEINVDQAVDAAARDTRILGRAVSQVEGQQKTTLAAAGIGGGSVTGEDIAMDTFNKAKLDEMTIRFNADLKSWDILRSAKIAQDENNYTVSNNIWEIWNTTKNAAANARSSAYGYRLAGRNAIIAGNNNANASLLGSIGSIGNSYMNYWKETGGSGGSGKSSGGGSGKSGTISVPNYEYSNLA